ncbi:hypothetical protein SAMN05421692_2668 [Chryseobacterium indologenes]|nr:hypothetical protein SAMN05421692_2668 [Chryseobacterium indologenes]SUX51127.1 Uncharacterised protein [Chryseobacterium indologenes]VFA42006.1 Uncharacterised protein [Chryseobacterium indologenes]
MYRYDKNTLSLIYLVIGEVGVEGEYLILNKNVNDYTRKLNLK